MEVFITFDLSSKAIRGDNCVMYTNYFRVLGSFDYIWGDFIYDIRNRKITINRISIR